MAHQHSAAPASNRRWFAGLGALGLLSMGLALGWHGLLDHAHASPIVTGGGTAAAGGGRASAPSAATPNRPAAQGASPVQAQAMLAAQQAAAREVAQNPVLPPLAGPVTERPPYVSPMEWMMLKAAAQQHSRPDDELTRLVNFLRFNKQLEAWQGLGPRGDVQQRRLLAEQLLADLPARLLQREMSLRDLQQLQPPLVADAVPDPAGRPARAASEARRLMQAQARLAQQASRPQGAARPSSARP